MIVVAGVGIRSNMRVQQEGLPILNQAVGILEIGFALPDRLDLGPAQGHPRLVLLEKEVVVGRLAILGGVAGAGSHRVPRSGLGRVRLDEMAGRSGHNRGGNLSSYIAGPCGQPAEYWPGNYNRLLMKQEPQHGAGVRYYTRHEAVASASHSSLPGTQGSAAPACTIPSPHYGAA